MRILTVIPVLGAGGAETVADALARDQLRAGRETQVASAGGFRADGLRRQGADLLPVPLTGRRPHDLLRSTLLLRAAARRRPPTLVHAHNVKATVVARLAVGRSVPVVATMHGVPNGQYAVAARLLDRSADEVVAVSAGVADRLVTAGLAPSRLRVVENCVLPDPHRAGRDATRRLLGLPEGVPVVVCVARMAPQKRHDTLIAAWRHVSSPAVLLLVGDGPTRPAVEAAIHAAGLGDRILLLGERDDVPDLLACAEVAVLPTAWEGLPISVLEAMAAGMPVVASDVGDLAETVGRAATLVAPGSPRALADALDELLLNPSLRAVMAARGRELVTERYGLARMLEAYRAVYDEAAGADTRVTHPPLEQR
jgi:glycosyltransferase involved in cell wall biosynthesis